MMKGILIKNALLIPLAGERNRFRGDLVIEGNIIKAIGENLSEKWEHENESAYKGYTIIEGRDRLVIPGFVNCHTHAAMSLLRGYADDLPLMPWLETKIWPREAHLEAEDIYWGAQLAVLEMLKSGTTTFADMYFFMEETAQVVLESGIRACLARGMVGLGENAELAISESVAFVQKWHGKADGRISCFFGPHAPYTCPPAYLQRVMGLADDYGVGIHIHLAETQQEVGDICRLYGQRPVELLEAIGFFEGRHVLAAHCVHLSDNEIGILAKHRVGVAHNPESNMKLAGGIAPIPKLLANGVTVGLGTDSAASNNNLDMLEEMRTCALLHKVANMDPTVLPAPVVLEMATKKGAEALGLSGLGSLAPGQKADLLLLDLRRPHLTPLHDPIANLVYAAQSTDVNTVIIDGEIIMKERQILTMDEERILYEAGERGRMLADK